MVNSGLKLLFTTITIIQNIYAVFIEAVVACWFLWFGSIKFGRAKYILIIEKLLIAITRFRFKLCHSRNTEKSSSLLHYTKYLITSISMRYLTVWE